MLKLKALGTYTKILLPVSCVLSETLIKDARSNVGSCSIEYVNTKKTAHSSPLLHNAVLKSIGQSHLCIHRGALRSARGNVF